jgi:hypothetical protein
MRRKNVARACCSACSAPDSLKVNMRMIHGAASTATRAIPTTTRTEVVTSADTESQASSSRRLRSSSTSTGMNTEVSTPPRISS